MKYRTRQIYGGKKLISCPQLQWRDWLERGPGKCSEVIAIFCILMVVEVACVCVHWSKFTLFSLNRCILFYVNYTLVKLIFFKVGCFKMFIIALTPSVLPNHLLPSLSHLVCDVLESWDSGCLSSSSLWSSAQCVEHSGCSIHVWYHKESPRRPWRISKLEDKVRRGKPEHSWETTTAECEGSRACWRGALGGWGLCAFWGTERWAAGRGLNLWVYLWCSEISCQKST